MELLLPHPGAADLKLPSRPTLHLLFHASDNPRDMQVETGKVGAAPPVHPPSPCQFPGRHPCSPHRMSHSVPDPSYATQASVTNNGIFPYEYLSSLMKH